MQKIEKLAQLFYKSAQKNDSFLGFPQKRKNLCKK